MFRQRNLANVSHNTDESYEAVLKLRESIINANIGPRDHHVLWAGYADNLWAAVQQKIERHTPDVHTIIKDELDYAKENSSISYLWIILFALKLSSALTFEEGRQQAHMHNEVSAHFRSRGIWCDHIRVRSYMWIDLKAATLMPDDDELYRRLSFLDPPYQKFLTFLVLPWAGELRLEGINKMLAEGIYPLRLTIDNAVFKGAMLTPAQLIINDFNSFSMLERYNNPPSCALLTRQPFSYAEGSQRIKAMINEFSGYSKEMQEMFHFLLYIMCHELFNQGSLFFASVSDCPTISFPYGFEKISQRMLNARDLGAHFPAAMLPDGDLSKLRESEFRKIILGAEQDLLNIFSKVCRDMPTQGEGATAGNKPRRK